MTQRQKQGSLGELYVQEYYECQGYTVHPSQLTHSYFDLFVYNEKTSFTVQVKALTRYVTNNYFSIENGPKKETISNTLKCDKLLIVVKKPDHPRMKEDILLQGKIIEINNHQNLKHDNKTLIIPTRNPRYYTILDTINLDKQKTLNEIVI